MWLLAGRTTPTRSAWLRPRRVCLVRCRVLTSGFWNVQEEHQVFVFNNLLVLAQLVPLPESCYTWESNPNLAPLILIPEPWIPIHISEREHCIVDLTPPACVGRTQEGR